MPDTVTLRRLTTEEVSGATRWPIAPPPTRTIDELVEVVGHLRNVQRLIKQDMRETASQTQELHRRAFQQQINLKAREAAKRPASEMLNSLADQGFAWRDVARIVGVSVPAVRKWRHGETPTPRHLMSIAQFYALTVILREDHLVFNVARWMEVPLIPDATVTGLDLAAFGKYVDLCELAAQQVTPEEVLDRLEPGWRDNRWSNVEVFRAADGEFGLRPVSSGDD